MSDTLRDQLLGLGFKPAPRPEKPVKPQHDPGRKSATHATRTQGAGAQKPHGKQAPRKAQTGRPANPANPRSQHHSQQQRSQQPRTQQEIDLAKAYAIRAQKEKDERIEAERLKQEDARKRREAKARLAELLKDQALNDKDADIARHFDYGGKIKRVYVNAEQLKALNAGELGVVQLDGRYLLVAATLLAEAETIFAPAIALKVDPNAPVEDDPYADPHYQVPDDLVW